jgi:hypothetical protein
MGVVPYGPVFVGMNEVEETSRQELKERLDALGEKFGIPSKCRHFLSGTPAKEIHRFVAENNVDLGIGHPWPKGCAIAAGVNRKFGAARSELRCAGGSHSGK